MNQTEKERFIKLEAKVDGIEKDVREVKTLLKEHINWETDKYEKLDDKYLHKEEADRRFSAIEAKNVAQDKTYGKIIDWALRIITVLVLASLGLKTGGII